MLRHLRLSGCVMALVICSAACARTDPGITASVKAKLVADDMVKANDIDVTTMDRTVTLNGEVATQTAKDRALRIARETDGVQSVIDNLTVQDAAVATSGTEPPEPATGDARDADQSGDQSAAKKTTEKAADATTDAALTAAIKTKLLADTKTPGLKIDVDTSKGVVTLTGEVANAAERTNAASIARDTKGVKRVVNKLTIKKKA
jgi:hyperosmotically inducible protein